MATRYFNWRLAVVLLVAIVVFAAAAVALHGWQVSTRADKALLPAEKAYAEHDWDEAALQFGKYITRNSDDVAALMKYADAQLNRRPVTGGNVQQAVGAYRSVLRLERDNTEAARRLTEIYLQPGMMDAPGEAELIARRYLEGRDDLTLRRSLADALRRQRKFGEAVAEINRVLEQHPDDVLAYELMGVIADSYPVDPNKPAAFWFDEAIAKNPDSALAYIARAGFYLRHNERAKTTADLDRAMELNPADAEIRLRLIRELLNANLLEKAREHLRALQAKEPANEDLWRNWAELALRDGLAEEMYTVAETGLTELAAQPWDFMPVAAELYIRSGHVEKAQSCISRMQSKEYLPYVPAFLNGLAAAQQGRLREAAGEWQKAIGFGYRAPAVYMLLSSALNQLGDTQAAIAHLRTLLSENPGSLEGRLALARLLAQVRNWPGALPEALRIQQSAPGHPEAVLLELEARTHILAAGLGGAATQQDSWPQIEARLARLNELSKGALPVRLLQAQAAMSQAKLAEAAAILGELEEQHPSDLRVMMLRAELCLAEDKTDEAKTRFQEMLRQFPQSFEVVRSCVALLNRLNDRQRCESTVKEALARFEEPTLQRNAGLLMAELYRRWQENDKLLAWVTDLAVRFPNDIQCKRLLLACEPIEQNARKTQEIIDEVMKLEGEAGWQWRYEQARFWIREGIAKKDLEKRGARYAQIVKLLQENLLKNPTDQASRLLLADVYERVGEQQLALAAYREAHSRSPESMPILVRAVTALHRAGLYDDANEILEAAKRRNPDHPDLQRLILDSSLVRADLATASSILGEFIEQDPNDATARLTLAQILVQQKKFDEAAKILDDLWAKSPDSAPVIAVQVQLHIEQGNTQEAIRFCNEAVTRLGGASAYLLRAKTYARMGQDEKALQDYSQAIAAEPNQAYTWASRAEFHHLRGRMEEAASDIRKAMALSPDNLPLQRLAISMFIVSGSRPLLDEAETLLDKAIKAAGRDPQSADSVGFGILRARALLLRGTGPGIEEARRLLREITDAQPRHTEAWTRMVRLELEQREPAKALDIAVRGLTHNPESRQLLMLKAIAEKERAPALAAVTFKGLLEQYPSDIEILIELADAYSRAGRPEQAAQLLRQRAAGFEGLDRRRCDTALAAALYTSGQKEEAKSLFQTLMQAEPNDPTPVVALVQLLRRDKRWTELNQYMNHWRNTHPDDVNTAAAFAGILVGTGDREAVPMAEDLLRMTLRQNPDSMTCLIALGMLMHDAERHDEAVELNRRILRSDPNNVTAMNNLAWLLCENRQQYNEALALAERGMEIAPQYMDLIDTRGVIYHRLGRFDEAVADFVKCIELYPANSPGAVAPHFHLARTYAGMKRRTQAVEQLKTAMTMNRANIDRAREYVNSGRKTHAAKLLRDTLRLHEEMEELIEALNLREQAGGFSAEDSEEARLLLDQLQKGS